MNQEVKGQGTVVIRKKARRSAIFIDGIALDRASKRLERRIDWPQLTKLLKGGLEPELMRYYTIIPNEDDARHHSYLAAVEASGFSVYVKRLPPKGSNRIASYDLEIACDLLQFSLGNFKTRSASSDQSDLECTPILMCPSKEMEYPLKSLQEKGIEVSIFDFVNGNGLDLFKYTNKWNNISESPIFKPW